MITRMRDRIDWLVPIGVGVALGVGFTLIGDSLGWSDGAKGTTALVGVLIGVALRFWIHDYEAEERHERAARG